MAANATKGPGPKGHKTRVRRVSSPPPRLPEMVRQRHHAHQRKKRNHLRRTLPKQRSHLPSAVSFYPPTHRQPNNLHSKPSNINGITADLLASVLGTPQILTPCKFSHIDGHCPADRVVAQFEYESKRSGQTEYHPIYSTILGPKGSDTMLVKLVEATFQQAQWRTKVDTGRFTFPPSQNARKVDDKPVRGSPDSLQEAQVEIGEL